MLEPFWVGWIVAITGVALKVIPVATSVCEFTVEILPENDKLLFFPIPFPSFPLVTIYWTVITASFNTIRENNSLPSQYPLPTSPLSCPSPAVL
mgnify:CR=1 FL=1